MAYEWDSEVLKEIYILERQKIRPIGELLLNPGNTDARKVLVDLEDQLTQLRNEITVLRQKRGAST